MTTNLVGTLRAEGQAQVHIGNKTEFHLPPGKVTVAPC